MTRPTSLCRSCSLNVVILPLGISVSTASSGNSTNWRITNSRNSLMTEKLSTNEHESTRISALTLRRFSSCRFCNGSRRCLFRGSAGHLCFILLHQTANRVGRLRAFADPVFGPIQFQRAVVAGLLGVVRADDLDKLSIAWAAAVGHHHFVIGAILRSFPA